ncbi:MAG: ATP-dependent Clp protease adaptor ClpS [Fimbriimonadales bacterium]
MSRPTVLPDIHELGYESTTGDGGFIVTVFNNEYNTYEEVMHILQVATGCTPEEAYIETWEVDHLGKCVVHKSSQAECDRVAKVIATIGIQVSVGKD